MLNTMRVPMSSAFDCRDVFGSVGEFINTLEKEMSDLLFQVNYEKTTDLNKDNYIIQLDLPGANKSNLSVEVFTDKTLKISYNKCSVKDLKGKPINIKLPLEYNVDPEELSISLLDGIFRIQYPVKEKSKSSRGVKIPIN